MPAAPDEDRRAAVARGAIPSPAEERLAVYVALLRKWQRTLNLVAPSTLGSVWMRHVLDSWQVADAAPGARRWIDMGSGAGFPGLVLAIRLAETPDAHVDLVESDQRKAAFLREVSRETGAPATVTCARIETAAARLAQPDAVTARALASLPDLVAYAQPWLAAGAIGVFPKGQDVARELTDSDVFGKFSVKMRPSLTDPAARIVVLHMVGHPSLEG